MTLKDCTKEELIYIIKRLTDRPFESNDYYVKRILIDLEYKREQKKFEKAENWAIIANDARMKYCSFLKKYEGVRLLDIPIEDLKEADELLKTAERADKEYNKLIGIE